MQRSRSAGRFFGRRSLGHLPATSYAPGIYSPISLYDTIRQVAINQNLLPHPGQPSFVEDIWPILTRAQGMLRVAAAAFGAGDHGSMASVIPPGPGQNVARQAILGKIAPPPGPGNVGNPNQPANMPLLNSGSALGADPADIPPTLRQFQYDQMSSWSQNNFINDWPPVAPTAITPDGLTQAALENCVGAPFFPGIEATVSVNDGTLKYTEPFRFDQTNMHPGDVTKGMARPWAIGLQRLHHSSSQFIGVVAGGTALFDLYARFECSGGLDPRDHYVGPGHGRQLVPARIHRRSRQRPGGGNRAHGRMQELYCCHGTQRNRQGGGARAGSVGPADHGRILRHHRRITHPMPSASPRPV